MFIKRKSSNLFKKSATLALNKTKKVADSKKPEKPTQKKVAKKANVEETITNE